MDTMNALVWKGDGALSLERRPIPALQGTPCPARRGAGP